VPAGLTENLNTCPGVVLTGTVPVMGMLMYPVFLPVAGLSATNRLWNVPLTSRRPSTRWISVTRPWLIVGANVVSTAPVVASSFAIAGRGMPLTVVNSPPM
jgi:hypothetical protein